MNGLILILIGISLLVLLFTSTLCAIKYYAVKRRKERFEAFLAWKLHSLGKHPDKYEQIHKAFNEKLMANLKASWPYRLFM